MMEYIKEGRAFAGGNNDRFQFGMSQRFYAACAAMQGLLSASNILHIKQPHIELLTTMSFQIADELLKQEYNEQE